MLPKLISLIVSTESCSVEAVLSSSGKIYTFLNPVSYLEAVRHEELFSRFDGIWADGSLLVSSIRLLYGRKVTRRSFDMTSVAPLLLDYAEQHGKSVYIVASRREDVERAIAIFRERNPGIRFVGWRDGYFCSVDEMQAEARHICKVGPDFLIVGMGILRQEEFLLRVKDSGFDGVGFTCGGFIHQTAHGNIDYYPAWIDRLNLRFLYRMIKEDYTRRRYIRAALSFPALLIRERLSGWLRSFF